MFIRTTARIIHVAQGKCKRGASVEHDSRRRNGKGAGKLEAGHGEFASFVFLILSALVGIFPFVGSFCRWKYLAVK